MSTMKVGVLGIGKTPHKIQHEKSLKDLAVEAGVRSLLAECAHELGAMTCVVNSASQFEQDDAATFSSEIPLSAGAFSTATFAAAAVSAAGSMPPIPA